MIDTSDAMATDLEPLMLALGKAVYIYQAFESTLCLLHAMMTYDEAGGQEGAFKGSWDFHSAKTLGQTINALCKRIEIPTNFNDYLKDGVKCRNQIVHGFMTKNMPRLIESKDRLEVQKELEALKLEVKRCDIEMNKLLDVIFAKYGLSNNELKRQAGELYATKNNPCTSGMR